VVIDFFGHVAYAGVLAGMILLTRQNIFGWLVKAAGDAGWVVLGIVMGMSSIITWGLFFVLLDLIGYAKWRKDRVTFTITPRNPAPVCQKVYWHGPDAETIHCGEYSPELGHIWHCGHSQ
jgi:hypothetical protein